MHFFAGNMPRLYKRPSERGGVPRDVLERAALATHDGISILVRSAARDFGIDRMTLKRFC